MWNRFPTRCYCCHLVCRQNDCPEIMVIEQGGTSKTPELSSGGWTPYSTGFPCYVTFIGTHLYQCTTWHCCERLHSASVNFFEDFQHICPFHGGCYMSAPAHTVLTVQQFLTKNGMTLMPHPPYSPNLVPSNYFPPMDEKGPERETFC